MPEERDVREDFLQEFGASAARGEYETDADLDAAEAETVEGEETETEEAPVVETEEAEETQGEGEEEEQEVDDSPEAILARVSASMADTKKPEQSELDRLRQENEQLRKSVQEEIAAVEARLRGEAKKPQDTPATLDTPRWADVLVQAGIDEETARTIAPLFKVAVDQTDGVYKSKFTEVEQKLKEFEKGKEASSLQVKVQTNLRTGLESAYSLGGMEKALVEDFYKKGNSSWLGKEILSDPSVLSSPGAVLRTVNAVARQVELAGSMSSTETQAAGRKPPTTTTTSARGKASAGTQGKTKVSPEDAIKTAILGAREPVKALGLFD